MVPSFCRLELPQPSYDPISFYEMRLFYKCFIQKIPACTIMSGFCKLGTYQRFQEVMAACTKFPLVAVVGILSWYVLDLVVAVRSF